MGDRALPAGLAGFLRSRLDEDEAVARAAIDTGDGQWHVVHDGCDGDCPARCPRVGECHAAGGCYHAAVTGDDMMTYPEGGHTPAQADHTARHDPARVLREAAAWRAVLAEHVEDAQSGRCARRGDWKADDGDTTPWPCRTVRGVAVAWSGHPDYQLGWMP